MDGTLQQPRLVLRQYAQFVTVQDGGRVGWKRYGVPRGGAMDLFSLAAANALVGNPLQAAALEFMFVGGEYELAGEAASVAVTGGNFPVFRNGERMSTYRSIRLERGDLLRIGADSDAVWGYLAAAGGVAAPLELGSASTHVQSGIGGLAGRALEVGDAVPLGFCARQAEDRALYALRRPADACVRVVLGPQDDYFGEASIAAFLSAEFTVTNGMDRMGYNLSGPRLSHSHGADMISDGVMPGCIQVPGSGQAIVLFADCQSTGGYPKIATVLSADLGRLAQSRPGRAVRFRAVTAQEAARTRNDHLQRLGLLPRQATPMMRDLALERSLDLAAPLAQGSVR